MSIIPYNVTVISRIKPFTESFDSYCLYKYNVLVYATLKRENFQIKLCFF